MSAAEPGHALRRALVGGYRVADVELAVAKLELALTRARLELEATKQRLGSLEGALSQQNTRLDDARRAVAAADEELKRLQARLQDTEHLARARIEAAERDLTAERAAAERLQVTHEELVGKVQDLARDLDDAKPTRVAAPQTEAPPARPARTHAPPIGADVELEAGPFDDLASLTAFERSVAALPHVTDVYIRHYESERATLELVLDEPSNLIHELTRRLPYRLDVDDADERRISLTVFPDASPA
jgi:multidrug efflux pump subunit AcrA (membrane-fusion protein)